jgi:cytosine/adenosine deaminase-related metal-dependent hydrolase
MTLLALALAGSSAILAQPAATPTPAAAAAPPRPCPAGAAESRVYALLLRGNRAGSQTSCRFADGHRETLFSFNDRGRGPELATLARFDETGLPLSIETDGHDYFKGEVHERFTRSGKEASWMNKAEEGGETLSGDAYYVSLSGAPEDLAWLARAVAKRPGRRLALLPAGEATVEPLGQRRVESGGKSRSIRLHAVGGLDFHPSYVWLDEAGELYAIVSDWFTVIPEGWESLAPDLLRVQQEGDAKRSGEAVRRVRRIPGKPLVFTGARLFDSSQAVSLGGRTVVVSGNRITAVGVDGGVAIPPGAETIDGKGKTLLPGLWDMHTHPSPSDGMRHLAAGVTAIRDMAAEPETPQKLRAWETGETAGPRVVYAGIVDGPGPFQGPTKTLVATETEAVDAVRRIADAKFRQVKIYSSVKPELVPVLVREAHARGLRVSGHIPAFMTAEQAVRDGYDEIQHMNFLFLNFWADEVPDTRGPARFTALGEKAFQLDLFGEKVQAFLRLLKEHRTVIDPTLGIFEGMFTSRPGRMPEGFAPVADALPAQVRRQLLSGGLPVPEGMNQRYLDAFTAMEQMLALLEKNGIPIVAGTDGMPGFALQRELEIYVDAGLPAGRVLQIATRDAARVAGRSEDLGAVEPGKLADLVLVDGDPTQRIQDVRNVSLVVKDGAVYDPKALRRELGIRP